MTMASGVFGLTLEKQLEKVTGAPDMDADTFKTMLVTNTYTPNFDTHDFQNDVTNEVSGTGYTTNGISLTTVASGVASGFYTFDADDSSWTTSTITARGEVIYDSTPGSSATNHVVIGVTFGADYSTTAGTFTIQRNASGIWTIDYIP